jgi:hypothetical protein
MEQFQAPDGMLPDDDKQLARMSRLGAEWATVADDIRAALTSNSAGRIYSTTQYELWLGATKRHNDHVAHIEAVNKARAERRNKGRNGDGDNGCDNRSDNGCDEIGKRKGKGKGNKKTSKTCAVDNRAADFRGAFQDAFQVANAVPAPWDGKEATLLARFLKANPTITLEQWRRILHNRHNSPINHKASLSMWVGKALAWLDAPADEWGKPLKGAAVVLFPQGIAPNTQHNKDPLDALIWKTDADYRITKGMTVEQYADLATAIDCEQARPIGADRAELIKRFQELMETRARITKKTGAK